MERFCTNNYRLSKPQLQAIARWLHLNDGGVKAAIASIVVEYLIGLVPDPNDLSMAEAALHSFREVAVHGSQAHPTDLARVEPIMRAARAQHEAKAKQAEQQAAQQAAQRAAAEEAQRQQRAREAAQRAAAEEAQRQ